jgi:hypothetical protein
MNNTVTALRFFFRVTLDRPEMARHLTLVRQPRKLPSVLSQEDVVRLLEGASRLKYRAALGVAYGAGLRVSEVSNLPVSDIDSKRMLIRVEEGSHAFGPAASILSFSPVWKGSSACSTTARTGARSQCSAVRSSLARPSACRRAKKLDISSGCTVGSVCPAKAGRWRVCS